MHAADPAAVRDAARKWTRATWLLLLAVTAARIIYLIAMCPIELAGDEAQYWDWSRRLDLSYYSKGPGIAWLIAVSTSLFGATEWSVRLPAVFCGTLTALLLAWWARRLARGVAAGDERTAARAGFFAAALFMLPPVYQATSLLMTIDGPYVMCWVAAGVCAWRALEPDARLPIIWWALFGLALGVGFLFKYTILFLLVGLMLFIVIDRPRIARLGRGMALAGAVFAIAALPVLIWNWRMGWPTVAHLLGHLGAKGGDRADLAAEPWRYDPMWTIEMIGAQLGFVGPALVLLGVAAARWISAQGEAMRSARRAGLFVACASAPVILFYFLLTFAFEGEANWPIAGYALLLAPAACVLAAELDRYRTMVSEWMALPERPKRGFLRRKPEALVQVLWHWSLGYGIVVSLGLVLLPAVARLPVIGRLVPMHRFSGWRETAAEVDRWREELRENNPTSVGAPIVIAHRYDAASRLAFYLRDRPPVFSAASFMGDRKSSYDYFTDTDLRRPDLHGRSAVLVGAGREAWAGAFRFNRIETQPPGANGRVLHLGIEYGGPMERGLEGSGEARGPDG